MGVNKTASLRPDQDLAWGRVRDLTIHSIEETSGQKAAPAYSQFTTIGFPK